MATGTLYVVSTPLGNLEDITLRAIRILKTVDVVAAEDTRVTHRLLSHLKISKPLVSCWEHNEIRVSQTLIDKLKQGQSIALVSDAGTPCISDPGTHLVRNVLDERIPIQVIPGPSAVTAAISGSGMLASQFLFLGFLPRKEGELKTLLHQVQSFPFTLVFFETKNRLLKSLSSLLEILGNRRISLCKELTKLHEKIFFGTIQQVLQTEIPLQGEWVLVIEGSNSKLPTGYSIDASPKALITTLAKTLNLPRNRVYQCIENLKHGLLS